MSSRVDLLNRIDYDLKTTIYTYFPLSYLLKILFNNKICQIERYIWGRILILFVLINKIQC